MKAGTDIHRLTHGSLFSGIGGFESGADLEQIETMWNCEIEPYQRKILKQNWPNTKQYEDIRKIKRIKYVDIVSGGFPCQDISIAGKGKGIHGVRSGLWSEMHRVCRIIKPKYIIIENSPMLLIRGLEKVLCDLSEIGYNAEWRCLSNKDFGFPHKRERLYIIAYSYKIGLQGNLPQHGSFTPIFKKWSSDQINGFACAKRFFKIPESTVIRNDDGFQNWAHRVGAIGNSVNPIVASYLFKCIKLHFSMNEKT